VKTPFRIAHINAIPACVAVALCLPAAARAASEVYPGAFEAASPGTRVAGLYYYQRSLEGYYVNGSRLGGAKVEGQAVVAAFSVYGQLSGMTSSWTLTLPYIQGRRTEGVLPAGFGSETSGVGDLRIGYTLWPVNDRAAGQWLAVSGTLQTPTGHYDHSQSLNAGDRRWKATLQMAWVRYLSPAVAVELIPEVTFYGANTNYVGFRMTQAPAPALTTYLRWKFSPGWETQAGLQFNTGGEQTIGGVRRGNEPRNRRVFLGASTLLSPTVKLNLRYSRDTAVNYELKTTRDLVASVNWAF
jgi:hypothetical protein